MPQLHLSFLGPPRLLLDGDVCSVSNRKVIALLAYLAATGRPCVRTTLATLLWPDSAQGLANLRNSLWIARRTIGAAWLHSERDEISLPPQPELHVDVRAFRAGLERAREKPAALEEVLALYRDDFLAGFSLGDSAAWDEWQRLETEHLHHAMLDGLARLVQHHTTRQAWEPAIRAARRWNVLDPLHEEAHRQLMRLFAWSGQRTAALRQYQRCRALFQEELGLAPTEETLALYEAIRAGTLAARPTAAGPSETTPPRRGPYPLVGREREMAALQDAYSRVGPDGRVVVLEGEAGIGKSRLAEEFVTQAGAQGAAVLRARSYEGERNLTYGLFLEGAEAALARIDRARLAALPEHVLSDAARLLPALATVRDGIPTPAPLDNPGAQSRFFASIGQLLATMLGGTPPGVLFLDDLHWADSASLKMLLYLVRRLAGRPLFFLLTWRSGQPGDTPALQQLLIEAQRAGRLTHLRLDRLQATALAPLLEGKGETLGQRLYEETEGLPFFVIEYLTALDSGTLRGGAERWSLPDGARDLLRARLHAVAGSARRMLRAAAVIGRSSDFELLCNTSGHDEEAGIEEVEALVRLGLLAEEEGAGSPRYRFTHQKLRALLYEEMSAARRQQLHRRAADALRAGAAQRGELAGQVAHHFVEAGQQSEAAYFFKLAGNHARALYANDEALAHFQHALSLGHPEEGALHEAIGDMQTLLGRYAAAHHSYQRALDGNAPVARVRHKLGNLCVRQGEWAGAETHFAAAAPTTEAAARARLFADWSLAAHRRGAAEQARARAEQALAAAEQRGDGPQLAHAHNILGILARGAGRLDEARDHFCKSLALVEAAGDVTARVAALNNLALVDGASGAFQAAIEHATRALRLCQALGDRHHEAALHNNLADLLHASGKDGAAMEHLTQAARLYAEIGRVANEWQPEIWKLAEW